MIPLDPRPEWLGPWHYVPPAGVELGLWYRKARDRSVYLVEHYDGTWSRSVHR